MHGIQLKRKCRIFSKRLGPTRTGPLCWRKILNLTPLHRKKESIHLWTISHPRFLSQFTYNHCSREQLIGRKGAPWRTLPQGITKPVSSVWATLSGLWLQVVSSQPRHRMAPATFRFAIRAYLGLPSPGCSPPTLRMCPVCHTQVDTIGTHWPSTCPTSRTAFTRRQKTVNHRLFRRLFIGQATLRRWSLNS